jgi:hypothetical protein
MHTMSTCFWCKTRYDTRAPVTRTCAAYHRPGHRVVNVLIAESMPVPVNAGRRRCPCQGWSLSGHACVVEGFVPFAFLLPHHFCYALLLGCRHSPLVSRSSSHPLFNSIRSELRQGPTKLLHKVLQLELHSSDPYTRSRRRLPPIAAREPILEHLLPLQRSLPVEVVFFPYAVRPSAEHPHPGLPS